MAPEGHGEHGSHGDGHGKDEQHHDEDPHSGEDPKHQGGSSGGGDGSVNPRDGEAERKRKADMDAINGGLDSGPPENPNKTVPSTRNARGKKRKELNDIVDLAVRVKAQKDKDEAVKWVLDSKVGLALAPAVGGAVESIIIEDAKGTDPIGQGPDNSNGYMRSRDPNLAFAATSCGRGIREAPSEALKNLVAINSVDAVWRLVGPVDPDPANKVIEIDHVLEFQVVAPIIISPTIADRPEFLSYGIRQTNHSQELVAKALKSQKNMIAVPRWFNTMKRDFFGGTKPLTEEIMQYLNNSKGAVSDMIKEILAPIGPQDTAEMQEIKGDPLVQAVFKELGKTRFFHGGWHELLDHFWLLNNSSPSPHPGPG